MTETRPTPVAIARHIVQQCYGAVTGLAALAGSNHAVFRVQTTAGERILKLAATADGRSIAKEQALIGLLGQRGIPVPVIDRCETNAAACGWPFLCTHCAGHETAFDCIRQPGPEKYGLFQQMGTIQAALHEIEFPADGDIQADGVTGHEPEGYWRGLADWAGQLGEQGVLETAEVDAFCALSPPSVTGRRLCHSDYHAVQCVVAQGRVSAVVDWESAWSGNRLVDLAITLAYFDFYAPPELTKRFLSAYDERLPLPADFERAYLPVRIGQTLGVLRAWHSRGPQAWALAIDSQRVARVVDLYRRYLCKLG